jgi:uncharacterized protein (TIGR02246 family)
VMSDDESEIRQLVDTWQAATRAGDVPTILSVMTDDVVFQVVGREPFGKEAFAALSAAPPGAPRPHVDAAKRIDEIRVMGDVAFMRAHLSVRITPPGAAEPIERAGYTLTIFQKIDGTWLLARDANLMVATPRTAHA